MIALYLSRKNVPNILSKGIRKSSLTTLNISGSENILIFTVPIVEVDEFVNPYN